ncbi:phosphotyrosyl phosphatase activator [Babesia gibsoni]|uniref:Serine/threonine-protein phosphatase 2A activator n=1 Tax=Babesia gibsoni TaxID=33632 RepID=A0AAD8PDF6_BABGI|nr:phosphotyrosyl phosphatase activator [Babesia gibsoni]
MVVSLNMESAPAVTEDIVDYVTKLNNAVMDVPIPPTSQNGEVGPVSGCDVVNRLINVLSKLQTITKKHKPEDYTGCRFGNKAHTAWLKEVREMWIEIAEEVGITCPDASLSNKIMENFLNSFGSDRIDYGTGHEIQFAYFMSGLTRLGLVAEENLCDVVLHVFSRYFEFVRYLIDRYNLEPAGSKGAWGLDDFQFLPFLLGSAQLVSNIDIAPATVVKHGECSPHKSSYIFIQAIEYVKEKVNGIPLNISSPMLNGICTSCTWRQINNGLMKMYKDDIVNISRIKHAC